MATDLVCADDHTQPVAPQERPHLACKPGEVTRKPRTTKTNILNGVSQHIYKERGSKAERGSGKGEIRERLERFGIRVRYRAISDPSESELDFRSMRKNM